MITDASNDNTSAIQIITTSKVVKTTHNVKLRGGIHDHEDYDSFIALLHRATKDDVINLELNTPGGVCSVGFPVIEAIKKTKARVDVEVVYPTASMGALLALSGNSLKLSHHSYIMFHDYSGGFYGKGEETAQHVESYRKVFKKRFYELCQPFLTKNECDRMFKGEDIYIHADSKDLKKRIARHFK